MRPPEFTGGNSLRRSPAGRGAGGFNEAAGIHRRKPAPNSAAYAPARSWASMRPPEFTGGNAAINRFLSSTAPSASMRPPEFTGGNVGGTVLQSQLVPGGASMRPPEFTGGNTSAVRVCLA